MVFEKSLTAMVKGIRAHRGKETEYINTCIQEIQKEVQSKNMNTKSMAVLKLAYLTMFGHDMTWATFAVVEVMSHARFLIKRPGYLASAMCFTDNTDVGLLTINLFKKDFGGKNLYETGLAISCLSSICTPEICRDVVGDLMAMLSSSRPYLRKKTVLCLYRIFLKDPPALRTCFPKLKDRLSDEDQGVLTASVNTFLELARKNAKNYMSLVPQLYHILVNTTNNWLSIKLLKLFQHLCPHEPRLSSKLMEPLINILNTTKAQSVEFEVIRCSLRMMPENNELVRMAIEKLQTFLNSSDRNLRYLALGMFKEALEKTEFKEMLNIPDLHSTVLTSIEESDTTARKIALQLLDRILTPATFADAVKTLLEFSKRACPSDEFFGTILRIGARDCYALVEDFEWYLLVLAEIARSPDSDYAEQAASQFSDVVARVAEVRPCAVSLALGLLDRSIISGATTAAQSVDLSVPPQLSQSKEGSLDIAMPMVGACAWVLGEYNASFEKPAGPSFVKAARSLLAKHMLALEPAIQTQCIWAALKLYMGSPKLDDASVTSELHELLTSQLPVFTQSTHVDVSERASFALHLAAFFESDATKLEVGRPLFEQPLLPVKADAQKSVLVPDGLNLDEAFFTQPEPQRLESTSAAARYTPVDPYALAATYKDDFGFQAAKETMQTTAATASVDPSSSMFYLQSKEQTKEGAVAEATSVGGADSTPSSDPLELMRERLAATRLGGAGSVKYNVIREEIQIPTGPGTAAAAPPVAAPAPTAAPADADKPKVLPALPEKEITDLQGRLYSMGYSDDRVRLYYCIKARNLKKQTLRIEIRCEKIEGDGTISDVAIRFPSGLTLQEADGEGWLTISSGQLPDRAKARATLALAPFLAPVSSALACQLRYTSSGTDSPANQAWELKLPATTFLRPCPKTEDGLAEFMAQHADVLLNVQTAETLSIQLPDKSAQAISEMLPAIISRKASLCGFHGLQQPSSAAGGKGHKFLLMADPPASGATTLAGQEALPAGAIVVCLCSALAKQDSVDLRVTVKACRKDVCDGVCAELINMLKELLTGRLVVA